ncbi:MAG: hypothetical protein BMS9Abin25_0375 [Gammaproteobacteria bacterium]|nr:MAG: hypothetical protein BMS9Abin25_0375 [Gammaproteobacteria bacterium]
MSIEKLKGTLEFNSQVQKLTDDSLFDFKTSNQLTPTNTSYAGKQAGAEDDNHKFSAGSFNIQVHVALKQFLEEKKDMHKDA